jgi:hypothetical protein
MPRKQTNWIETAEEQAAATEEQATEEGEVIPTVGSLLEELMALHASPDATFVGRYKRNGVWYDISIRRRNA